MNVTDFEYDGQYLSDYGFIICDFNGSSGADTVTAGSVLTFNSVPFHFGKEYRMTSTRYEECLQTEFDICKNPEVYDDLEITNDEFRDLMRWLNRREFLKFQVYDSEREYETLYFDSTFNINKIKIAEKLYGLHLTMETNRPFGYGMERNIHFNVADTSATYTIYDTSDEIGYIYPIISITCGASGNLTISNDITGSVMTINNCTANEEIEIDGNTQLITTSLESHNIYNDFNYDFLSIGNTFNNRKNHITFSQPCDITISYCPIIKDVP